MPDRMSNRMSEDMSDRMPEDLPVRKCINVMVGITRSKVIFFVFVLVVSNFHVNGANKKFRFPYIWKTWWETTGLVQGLSYMDPLMDAGTKHSIYMCKIARTSFPK